MLAVQRGNMRRAGAPSCGYRRGVGAKKSRPPRRRPCAGGGRPAGHSRRQRAAAAGLAVQVLLRSAVKPAHR